MLSQNVRKQIQTTEPKAGQPVSHNTTIFAFRVHKAKVRGLHVKAQVSQTESFLHWVVRGEKKMDNNARLLYIEEKEGWGEHQQQHGSNVQQHSACTSFTV